MDIIKILIAALPRAVRTQRRTVITDMRAGRQCTEFRHRNLEPVFALFARVYEQLLLAQQCLVNHGFHFGDLRDRRKLIDFVAGLEQVKLDCRQSGELPAKGV